MKGFRGARGGINHLCPRPTKKRETNTPTPGTKGATWPRPQHSPPQVSGVCPVAVRRVAFGVFVAALLERSHPWEDNSSSRGVHSVVIGVVLGLSARASASEFISCT